MVTTPGESLTRNTMPVVDAIVGKGAVPMVAGLTQDSLGYYIPTDEWMTGRNNGVHSPEQTFSSRDGASQR